MGTTAHPHHTLVAVKKMSAQEWNLNRHMTLFRAGLVNLKKL